MSPIVDRRWWPARVALVTATISFVCQAPALEIKRVFFATVAAQGDHPLSPLHARVGSHEEKLAFRLVPPLLVHFAHLSAGSYSLVQGVLGVATLSGLAWLFHHLGYSRRVSFALVFALAFTYMGSVWFVDTQPYFDAIAVSALVLAMGVTSPLIVVMGASVALWTDERSILALAVVALFHLRRRERGAVAAVGFAFAGYVALRAYLGHHYGLSTGKSEIGPSVFIKYWATMPVALLLSLEGLWGVIVVGLIRPMRDKDWVAWATAGCAAGSAIIAVMVDDVTRSTVYLLPAVVMAAGYLVERPEEGRNRVIAIATVLCVLIVTTPVILDNFGPLYPLPIRLIF